MADVWDRLYNLKPGDLPAALAVVEELKAIDALTFETVEALTMIQTDPQVVDAIRKATEADG